MGLLRTRAAAVAMLLSAALSCGDEPEEARDLRQRFPAHVGRVLGEQAGNGFAVLDGA